MSKIFSDRKKAQSASTIGVYVAMMIIAAIVFSQYIDRNHLQAIVYSSGGLGIAIYFLIEVIYVTLTPLFNTAILITSGYLFGGHVGFVLNFFATTAGLFLIVFLVKMYGRSLLQQVIPQNFYNRFDHLAQKIGPITLFIVYVLPFTPDDELTYIVAAGPIGIKRFILPILLGTLAKSAYSYIGDMGARGISIAIYIRVVLLVVGIIVVGMQEYVLLRKRDNYGGIIQ